MTKWQKFCLGWAVFSFCVKLVSLLVSTGRDRSDLTSYKETEPPRKEPIAFEICSVKKQAIVDGDTMRVTCGDRELTLHICGVDAPEIEQPLGIEARDYLRSLLSEEETILVSAFDRNAEGDLIAHVTAGDAEFIHEKMVRSGMAWYDEKFSEICPASGLLAIAAKSAKAGKLGVHGDPNAVTPWEWRETRESDVQ
ncbi:MAG: thermonuclease family protein [Cyanobacteria bacterium SBLK]|nr:thermonuclease family protein [Cyanobacteria bacterium SBLK]